MVVRTYKIVNGKRVLLRERKSKKKKRVDKPVIHHVSKLPDAPKKKKVTTLPTIELKKKGVTVSTPKGPSRAELDAKQRRREEAGEAEQETRRQAEQRRVIELNKAEEEADRRREGGPLATLGLDIAAGKQLPVGVKELFESRRDKTTAELAGTTEGKLLGLTSLAAEVIGGIIGGREIFTGVQAIQTTTGQRALVGNSKGYIVRGVKTGGNAFATNAKSTGLTKSFLVKLGIGVGAASLLVGAIGSYPYSSFIKEEALQSLSLPIYKAYEAGDLDTAERLAGEVDEILNAKNSIMSELPYANVQESLDDYFKAAEEANNAWKELIALKRQEQTGEVETEFARERRQSDEAAFERKRAFGEEETERFEGIEEEREERRRTQIEEESERFGKIQQDADERRRKQIEEDEERFREIRETADADRAAQIAADEERFARIREESQQRELDDLNFKEEYFALIRDGRYDEAAALLDAYEARLKGG